MHRRLLELLICPDCLPEERPLKAHIRQTLQGEVYDADLSCPGCQRTYKVDQGLADLLPGHRGADPTAVRYAEARVVSAYLWSHFADLFDDPDQHDAYLAWSNLLAPESGMALDIGCAVGRMTLELGRKADLAIGIDRSRAFILAARTLAQSGQLSFGLVMEGDLTEHREIRLADDWPLERVDFLLADALALPFARSVFHSVSSLNLLDKVPDPMRHLLELDRVTAAAEARVLISDPWSWSVTVAPRSAWLGGVPNGPNAGHAHVNLRRLLETGFDPPWQVIDEGTVKWAIRNHRNHYEQIHSDYLLARR